MAGNREMLAQAFPVRSRAMASWLADPARRMRPAPTLVMIDPTGRKRGWLLPTGIDGRRSPARNANYRDFVERLPAA